MKQIFDQMQLQPILVDVGASGDSPAIWKQIATHSVYVGFDPDKRAMQDINKGEFLRKIIIDKAVSGSNQSAKMRLYLAKSPFCSSTLLPNNQVLSDYLYADLFTIENEVEVPATTLEAILSELKLPRIDWLKLDTQGIDLQVLQSLSKEYLGRVMAVDVEPGLIDFYEDENTFCQIHPFLLEQGFWLSSMNVLGSARMRPETLARLQSSDRSGDWFEQRIRHTPGWIEARYLRRPDHIQTPEEHGLLWVFALLDHQYGFALDLAMNYQALFGKDTIFQIMQSIPIDMMKPPLQKSMSGFKQWVPTPVKHWIKQKLGIQK